MANEIEISYVTGRTVYALIRSSSGTIYNGSAFEAYVTANYTTYAVSMSEQGTASAVYTGNFPAISAGPYNVLAKDRQTGTAAETDPTIGTDTLYWGGSAVSSLSDGVTSGQLGTYLPMRISRGTMVQNFPIYIRSASDHVTPLTSGVVSGQIQRDGGTFGALQSGTISEVGLGHYSVTLTSGDTLANVIRLHFTAVGVSGGSSDPLPLAFVLQRVSGQTVA